MAKRKRLSPPRLDMFSAAPAEQAQVTGARVPIAQMAGDAAVAAAFGEVQAELQAAQREGRMVLSLPLGAIVEDHLIRDRLACDAEAQQALQDSLRQRGQQTPVEVTDLGDGRYGLISGWRRLRALRTLLDETGETERFGSVLALVRLPRDRPAAYVAMVEENEIRADLSFYERARIVAQAVHAGVYDSEKAALQGLFASASFSKRSKIKSFLPLVAALDGALRYPGQIPERLGLALSRALTEDPGVASELTAQLAAAPERDAAGERALLEAALRPAPAKTAAPEAVPAVALSLPGGVRLKGGAGRIALDGEGVTEALIADLAEWLRQR
ncbi:ParB/RepB/Spo0J family partition protein [Salipiger abyssi]|uniref:Putative transcriptional regulator n=1 Tax=Salipiger abyssi TaxID=1250539 RepID=A0A1P8V0I8_9RHOB|nr:ParB N-terminal domain-containing protein [Salipiger abyssi]APZ55174.1 putative transcriptional regulator [Salipiger abyssi]